jgi:hypothetical protein
MENFFNYITNPIPPDDVDIWLNVNNIITEKIEGEENNKLSASRAIGKKCTIM